MTSTPLNQANPIVAPWLKVAQSLVAPWSGLWTGDMARRQMEAMAEFNRQALRAWTGAWASTPAAASYTPADSGTTPATGPEPAALPAAPVVDAAPEAAEFAPAMPELPVAAPKKRAKPAARPRTTSPRGKAAPVVAGPRRGGPGKPKGATRH